MRKIKLSKINPERAEKEIGDFILNEVTSINLSGGVVGLSGGVDSTVTAALAKRAFDRYNSDNAKIIDAGTMKGLELLGYILPSNVNNPKDTQEGINVAKKLGIRYEICNIEQVVNSYREIFPGLNDSSYSKGNLMAEIRATILHTKAGLEKKLVLGTGNRDEDFELAYYTLFGDGAVHLSPIGGLPKRLVRKIANHLGFPEIANRTPTAGLENGQTDFKDLGYSYDFAELFGEARRQGFSFDEIRKDADINALFEKDKKEYQEKFGGAKFSLLEEAIENILRRNEVAEAKSGILHPPIAPVTLHY